MVVTSNTNHKKRLCIDYSQTINKFKCLDGYPLSRMQDIVRKVSQNKWYSTLDLKIAYHQIALQPEDQEYTAFEADGGLFQFTRVPFGLKNAIPCFQRIINDLIEQNDCKGTWTCLDNVTVAGKTKEEHDINLQMFLDVAKRHNITLNDSKCFYSADTIDLLGYRISRGTLNLILSG